MGIMVIETEIISKLVISVVIGGLIGWEREHVPVPAGLRTHMMVSLGAAMFSIIAVAGFGIDGSRVVQGVVTGIGFLGAGTIFKERNRVTGLTTAASLWTTTAIGVAVGIGLFQAAIVTTILVIAILELNKLQKGKMNYKAPKRQKAA